MEIVICTVIFAILVSLIVIRLVDDDEGAFGLEYDETYSEGFPWVD